MSDFAIRLDKVYKRFSLGERHDSLRDLIPSLAKRAVKRITTPQLDKQEFWALEDVSFEIKKGESVGIIGHNGAGKSTMLKHLSGVLQPTFGSIAINGRMAALIEVGAGFHQDLTGRENIFLNGTILGMSRADIRRKFDEIVDFSGIEKFIDTPVKRYSSGMYARLGFSVAAHIEPEILVIDEVLSVGDATFQAKGIAKMKSLLRSGATVIFVSHNLRSVAELSSRSLLLQGGKLISDGPTSEVIQMYMDTLRASHRRMASHAAHISDIEVRSATAKRSDFRAGEVAFAYITIEASEPVRNLDCAIFLQDDGLVDIFTTSCERLGMPLISLEKGQASTIVFSLNLHLAPGRYHLSFGLQDTETGALLDIADNAATVLISSDQNVSGHVHLYPTVSVAAKQSIHP